VARERPDILFVQSSSEVGPVARHREALERHGARVLVASPEAIDLCSDKAAMAAALDGLPVRQPRTLLPAELDEFVAGCRELGYPGVPVCFKPPVAKGLARLSHPLGRRRPRAASCCTSGRSAAT
jgi:carbamoyl-phosphate synthase large subunit